MNDGVAVTHAPTVNKPTTDDQEGAKAAARRQFEEATVSIATLQPSKALLAALDDKETQRVVRAGLQIRLKRVSAADVGAFVRSLIEVGTATPAVQKFLSGLLRAAPGDDFAPGVDGEGASVVPSLSTSPIASLVPGSSLGVGSTKGPGA